MSFYYITVINWLYNRQLEAKDPMRYHFCASPQHSTQGTTELMVSNKPLQPAKLRNCDAEWFNSLCAIRTYHSIQESVSLNLPSWRFVTEHLRLRGTWSFIKCPHFVNRSEGRRFHEPRWHLAVNEAGYCPVPVIGRFLLPCCFSEDTNPPPPHSLLLA